MTTEMIQQTAAALLSEYEQHIFSKMLAKGTLNDEQAQLVLQTRQQHDTSLLDILGAMQFVRLEDYAQDLAEVSINAYASELLKTDFFTYDEALIRRFDPAVMARYLFCPLQYSAGTLTILTTTLDEKYIHEEIGRVLPDADVMPFIGTERDVKDLLERVFQEEFSYAAVYGLRDANPQQSGAQVFTRPQLIVFALVGLALIVGLVTNFWNTMALLIVGISLLYMISMIFKFMLSILGWRNRFRATRHIRPEDLQSIHDRDLPIYSILVPVYKEPSVVPNLLNALADIDYPHEKLDVLILMEEDDEATIEAAKAADPPSYFRLIIVPDSQPRTKPKACNYGLHFCRGEFVTIYDAEDIPEPDQLRKAVLAFRRGDEDLICVQSALNYYNTKENYLTRMFTLEYTFWFDYMLPGLDSLVLPIPLGGTSNHFRMDALRKLGAWDPFNVTEDADLGIRAAANGYTVGIINSTTYEEANNHTGNWIRQRSRWIKGYMQTWLVHNRHPLQLIHHVGLKGWLGFQLLIGGTVWVFLINPIMWVLFLIWILFQPGWMATLFQGWVWDIAFISLVAGNGMAILLNVLATLERERNRSLFFFAISNPFYWVLHSIAAYKALWQLIRKPFYWEKTNHGLTNVKAGDLFTGADTQQPAATT
ncbi:MAG: glycosyltransferase [Anaerolineaceae bacterium]|nr:glycosyltransferase [Anaerolineaceae bacterium]